MRGCTSLTSFTSSTCSELVGDNGKWPTPSLEAALFPHLFPHGVGHFGGITTLNAYIKRRMESMFSLFTLHAPYVLIMYMLKQSAAVVQSLGKIALERDLQR